MFNIKRVAKKYIKDLAKDLIFSETNKSLLELVEINKDLEYKVEKLLMNGFDNTLEVNELMKLKSDMNHKIILNKNLIDYLYAFDYFKEKYPIYNLITKSHIDSLTKNNYDHEPVSKYYSSVPSGDFKVLDSMEIDKNDDAYYLILDKIKLFTMSLSYKSFLKIIDMGDYMIKEHYNKHFNKPIQHVEHGKHPLSIIAPSYCFSRGNVNKCEDILLLKPVNFKNETYYLVITDL